MRLLARFRSIVPLLLFAVAVQAEVFVEPTTVLVKDNSSVNSGSSQWYELTLNAGTELVVEFQVTGGLDNGLKVWLLDLANFQRFRAKQKFSYIEGTSGDIASNASYRIEVPQTNIYYLILDNRDTLFSARDVYTYAYKISDVETAHSKKTKEFYAQLYEGLLKKLFIFDDFDVYVAMCGTENAFSTPDIVICSELNALLIEKSVPGAATFVFLHEAAHSLLYVWNYPLYDNEDAADELATTLLLLMNAPEVALQAAKWWAQDMSNEKAISKLWVDDRHTISPQRARNIINWINNADDLTDRWANLLIPKMNSETLQELYNLAAPDSDPHREAMEHELIKRRAVARGERFQ